MQFDLSISIVLYRSEFEIIKKTIASVYNTSLNFKLYLIDNSPTDDLKVLKKDHRTEYIFCNANLGYGKANNIAMRRSIEDSKYHLVLNPDIYFDKGVLETIFNFIESNEDVGQVMPKICYPDGSIQRLCKLLPTPIDLFFRRYLPWLPNADKRNRKYELMESGYNKVMNIPFLSGCFMFFRTTALKQIDFFDERIFMYMEDADITRRMHQVYKTLFLPSVTVFHYYAKGSYKNFRLMLYHIHGAIIYFNKWGWLFDPQRKRINKKVMAELHRKKLIP